MRVLVRARERLGDAAHEDAIEHFTTHHRRNLHQAVEQVIQQWEQISKLQAIEHRQKVVPCVNRGILHNDGVHERQALSHA